MNIKYHKSKIIKSKFININYNYKILIIILILIIQLILFNYNSPFISKFEIDFPYQKYERNIITQKMKEKAGWMLSSSDYYFINGIIRKYKPIRSLEVGVANGGSSILILNAIKDIKNSILVSLDLNSKRENKTIGYRVKQFFPELMGKWMLFYGDQPHKFLVKLKYKFQLIFLDTAHVSPGELINIIEILPFINENAIIILHDIKWHFFIYKKKYPSNFTPSQIYLFSALNGNKILSSSFAVGNIGAVFLYKNQKNYYIDYFLLLLCFWEYMPTDNQINDLRIFIKKYYKKKIYLNIFNQAVYLNKKHFKKHNKF